MNKEQLQLIKSHIECLIPEEEPTFKAMPLGEDNYCLVVFTSNRNPVELPEMIENKLLKKTLEQKLEEACFKSKLSDTPYEDVKENLIIKAVPRNCEMEDCIQYLLEEYADVKFVIMGTITNYPNGEEEVHTYNLTSNDLTAWGVEKENVIRQTMKNLIDHAHGELKMAATKTYYLYGSEKEDSSTLLYLSKEKRKHIFEEIGAYIMIPYSTKESFIIPVANQEDGQEKLKVLQINGGIFGLLAGETHLSNSPIYIEQDGEIKRA